MIEEADKITTHSRTNRRATTDDPLIEVSPSLSRGAGYCCPVRITPDVASRIAARGQAADEDQGLNGRLLNTLRMARIAIDNAGRQKLVVPFEVVLGGRTTQLWARLETTPVLAIHIGCARLI